MLLINVLIKNKNVDVLLCFYSQQCDLRWLLIFNPSPHNHIPSILKKHLNKSITCGIPAQARATETLYFGTGNRPLPSFFWGGSWLGPDLSINIRTCRLVSKEREIQGLQAELETRIKDLSETKEQFQQQVRTGLHFGMYDVRESLLFCKPIKTKKKHFLWLYIVIKMILFRFL